MLRPTKKLKSLLRAAWLPAEGSRDDTVIRLVRYVADWGPSLDDVELFKMAGLETAPTRRLHGKHRAPVLLPPQPPQPVRKAKAKAKAKAKVKVKAAPKRKLRAAKMGAASRIRVGSGSRLRSKKVSGSQGPSKMKLQSFLVSFLEKVDTESTTFGELKEAAGEEFGELTEETISKLKELAAVAMRKQLRGKSQKIEPPQPVSEAPEVPKEDKELEVPEKKEEPAEPDSDSDSVSVSPIDAALLTPASPQVRKFGAPRSFTSLKKPKESKTKTKAEKDVESTEKVEETTEKAEKSVAKEGEQPKPAKRVPRFLQQPGPKRPALAQGGKATQSRASVVFVSSGTGKTLCSSKS